MFTAHQVKHLCTVKVAEHFTRFFPVFLPFFGSHDNGNGSKHRKGEYPNLHCFHFTCDLLSHPLISLPQAVHSVGVLCIVNDEVARSGMTSKSAFIKARIFGEPFHVVTFDKSQHEYYAKLSDFHAQFRMVGNNYNQTLKELKSHFSERRTMALVCKLEKYMMQLVQTMHKVTELTIEYRKKYAEK